jgi:hypothetical protein
MPALAWRLLHVLALCTLAITQPLLDILGENPAFFTAHDSSPGQVVLLVATVALTPALVLGGAEVAVHLFRARLAERLHLAILATLVFLVAIQIVDVLPGHWVLSALIAAAIAAGFMLLYTSKEAVRSVASVLAITPVLFVALFLFVSPASSIVFPDDVSVVELDDLLDDAAFAPDTPTADPDDADDRANTPLTIAERVGQRFPPIYFLVFDELPMASLLDGSGEIDRVRWPNFARLADTSHLFSNATTIGYTTERAIPAMLTARYETKAAPVYSLYPENLFTLLGDIYDVSSSDPLVDLCPPSVCNASPPQAMLDLLATTNTRDATGTTASPSSPTTTERPAPGPAPDTGPDSSFRLLVDDAMIVFGHLATPDGLDIGLPSIGSSWGDFGGDSRIGTETERSAAEIAAPAPTTPTTASTVPLEVEIGQVPTVDVDAVDADAVNDENTDFLDSLITDDSRVADFRAEVAAISAADTPRLHFLHTLLPHVPWRLHPNGETYADIALPGYVSEWNDDAATARAGQQRHLLQLQFADLLLGEYLDQLEREGILEEAMVIVAADHGISFVPGSRARGFDDANLGGIAGVPLFYKLPNQTEADRHHDPVETVDILPTIAAELEIDIPWAVDGVDLLGPTSDRVRAIRHPFWDEIPEPFPPLVDDVTADLLATFGNGTTGSLYGLAGLHDRMGQTVADLVDEPVPYCWVRDRPRALPDDDGTTGFVFGRLATSRDGRIPFAVTIGDTLTGTSVSLADDVRHRVFALGDPQYWDDATIADIGLHEIVDGRLRPIPAC